MKQVVQPVSGGPVEVLDVPRPAIGSTEVLVRTVASVISPGAGFLADARLPGLGGSAGSLPVAVG